MTRYDKKELYTGIGIISADLFRIDLQENPLVPISASTQSESKQSESNSSTKNPPRILITGAAKRIGRAIAEELFDRNQSLLLHVNHSLQEAQQLQQQWNAIRPGCCEIIQQDLSKPNAVFKLIDTLSQRQIQINGLVNNASVFVSGSLSDEPSTQHNQEALERIWKQNLQVNFATPSALIRGLSERQPLSSVVNLIDIYAKAGLAAHCAYVTAKAALRQSGQELARQLAPGVRVNSVSPGAILWPDLDDSEKGVSDASLARHQILQNTALKKLGTPHAIAKTVAWLLLDANYITGQNINVDGGRRWYI